MNFDEFIAKLKEEIRCYHYTKEIDCKDRNKNLIDKLVGEYKASNSVPQKAVQNDSHGSEVAGCPMKESMTAKAFNKICPQCDMGVSDCLCSDNAGVCINGCGSETDEILKCDDCKTTHIAGVKAINKNLEKSFKGTFRNAMKNGYDLDTHYVIVDWKFFHKLLSQESIDKTTHIARCRKLCFKCGKKLCRDSLKKKGICRECYEDPKTKRKYQLRGLKRIVGSEKK